jgi:dihydrofolate synthase/folylpolyglutamate synthase
MRKLLTQLGHPERGLNFIHLAGTNGKGSTAAAIDSMLREAGFFPGLYTSPHLVEFRERFRCGGVMVGNEILRKSVQAVIRAIGRWPVKGRPTFFEATTAVALRIFREAKVDFVVWETGLGGRLDATNVVMPECCVLTSLGRDHESILGQGWANLGMEKAGILKRGVPIFSAPWPKPAEKILAARVKKLRCPWQVVKPLAKREKCLPLAGEHQRQNLALALAVGRYLGLPETMLRRGLERTFWLGRFHRLPGPSRVVVDGAHNVEGVKAAIKTWRNMFGKNPERVIFGCLRDKPAELMLGEIRKTGAELWGVELSDSRGMNPLEWGLHPDRLWSCVDEALQEGRRVPVKGGTLILGSLVLVGEVLQSVGERAG